MFLSGHESELWQCNNANVEVILADSTLGNSYRSSTDTDAERLYSLRRLSDRLELPPRCRI